ncbi:MULTISPECIES: SRPBCC domain-containing protein [unclassified Beijerinckia]|uniref:SRPBCC family protein n=1 Tax=unclassified Beijerinckia TaxID=2638183 RepID=UPI00089BD840|nr:MULTISPECIES: SRPBCC domain-containing protein [unclassified Beijerinckia]MDH7795551.1 uncharacterized protein YndB with AHSA1/START domain [Beijerinckia sp. GAS462]SEC06277.1 glutathione S-transferase [Beijerinckia sp. 28-YEA-48]
MSSVTSHHARAVADISEGLIVASVEIAAPPERVFQALTTSEVCQWWVRPGVMDTREWSGDVRVGGRWQASGIGNGRPYVIEGEYLEIGPPRKLVHTWQPVGAPGQPSTVTYLLEPTSQGTKITLRHAGIAVPAICTNTGIAWETSFARLAEILAAN